MSQHPSLKVSSAGKRHRNVLKRYERIRKLKEKESWTEGKNSVFGLPKVKSQKLKAKGSSAKKEGEAEGKEGAPEAAKTEAAPKAEKKKG